MFIARSLVFYPGFFEDNCQELSDEIIIPSYHLNNLINEFEDNETLYVNIINTENNQQTLVAIGSPHNYDKNTIFAPQWILDIIGCTGNCDSVIRIEKADMIDVPTATKIIIKPLDPMAFELDTLACFEKAFMNLHSIKEGITLPVHVPELGKDYILFAHIEKVEPASLSRIVEGEVNVEFINEFNEHIPAAPTPSPVGLSPLLTPMFQPMSNPIVFPLTPPALQTATQEISAEERRRQVRESWLNRYQNNAIPR